MTLGGGETLCDTGQIIGDPNNVHKCMFQVIKPWKNMFWGWYPGAYAWSVIGDDPNWGYVFPYAITRMMSDKESTPMHVIARVGENAASSKMESAKRAICSVRSVLALPSLTTNSRWVSGENSAFRRAWPF